MLIRRNKGSVRKTDEVIYRRLITERGQGYRQRIRHMVGRRLFMIANAE